MSSRPQIKHQTITNGNMASASVTSEVTIIQKLAGNSVQLTWSGTSPVGVVNVQVSNDYSKKSDGSTANAGTWVTVPVTVSGSSVTDIPVSGNTGSIFVDMVTQAYAVRVKYTKTSGTGTIQAYIVGKAQ